MADDVKREAVTLERELAHRPSLRAHSLSSQLGLCEKASLEYDRR